MPRNFIQTQESTITPIKEVVPGYKLENKTVLAIFADLGENGLDDSPQVTAFASNSLYRPGENENDRGKFVRWGYAGNPDQPADRFDPSWDLGMPRQFKPEPLEWSNMKFVSSPDYHFLLPVAEVDYSKGKVEGVKRVFMLDLGIKQFNTLAGRLKDEDLVQDPSNPFGHLVRWDAPTSGRSKQLIPAPIEYKTLEGAESYRATVASFVEQQSQEADAEYFWYETPEIVAMSEAGNWQGYLEASALIIRATLLERFMPEGAVWSDMTAEFWHGTTTPEPLETQYDGMTAAEMLEAVANEVEVGDDTEEPPF